jgi:hypothetical protein
MVAGLQEFRDTGDRARCRVRGGETGMSMLDFSLLLGMLGGANVGLSWIGHRTGDAMRDVALMLATGLGMSAMAGVLYVLG